MSVWFVLTPQYLAINDIINFGLSKTNLNASCSASDGPHKQLSNDIRIIGIEQIMTNFFKLKMIQLYIHMNFNLEGYAKARKYLEVS